MWLSTRQRSWVTTVRSTTFLTTDASFLWMLQIISHKILTKRRWCWRTAIFHQKWSQWDLQPTSPPCSLSGEEQLPPKTITRPLTQLISHLLNRCSTSQWKSTFLAGQARSWKLMRANLPQWLSPAAIVTWQLPQSRSTPDSTWWPNQPNLKLLCSRRHKNLKRSCLKSLLSKWTICL